MSVNSIIQGLKHFNFNSERDSSRLDSRLYIVTTSPARGSCSSLLEAMIHSKGVLSYRGLVATDRDRQMGFDPLSLLSDIPTHDSILLPLNLQPSALLPEPAAVTCLAQVLSCSIFMHAGDFSEVWNSVFSNYLCIEVGFYYTRQPNRGENLN